MPRPKKKRCIEVTPCVEALVPKNGEQGSENVSYICLELDEIEAIRLSDYLGLYQDEAARRMGVSRVTFGRILKSARKKIASAILEGLSIKIKKQ